MPASADSLLERGHSWWIRAVSVRDTTSLPSPGLPARWRTTRRIRHSTDHILRDARVVVPVVQRVYYLDRANRRLMLYDGHQSDMPFIDNVVDLRFEYFADRAPSSVAWPAEGMSSCLFDAGSPPVSRLDDLGGEGLQPLAPARMTDGPVVVPERTPSMATSCGSAWCASRFACRPAPRRSGPEEPCSRVPGRSSSAYSYVPDFEVTFDVAPRNMTPAVFRRSGTIP